jgi:hypothetical protein
MEQSQMTKEQDAITLNQARDAQCKSEAIRQKVVEDIAKLGRAMRMAMAGLGMSLRPMTPEMLTEEVRRLPGVVRELELATT